jgi:hypothetical protein
VPTISFYQLALPASDNEGLKGFVKDSPTIDFFGSRRERETAISPTVVS